VRTELNLTAAKFPIAIESDSALERVSRWREAILRLARVSDILAGKPRGFLKKAVRYFYYAWWRPNDFYRWQTVHIPSLRGTVQIIIRGETVYLPLGGVVDFAAERARLEKELAKCDADIARVEQKLNNADFVKRAREEVVQGEREKRDEALARKAKIIEALQRLKESA
jgi:valyl-tRNA synthetase